MTFETINTILSTICNVTVLTVPVLAFVGGLIYLNHERA